MSTMLYNLKSLTHLDVTCRSLRYLGFLPTINWDVSILEQDPYEGRTT